MNKAGILFTLTSLLVAGFFIIMFSADAEPPLDVGVPALSFRIDVVDRFRLSWEDFTEESLKASGYEALRRMSEFANYQGSHYSDVQSADSYFPDNFERCILNGTLRYLGSTYNCSQDGIQPNNYTIYYWLDNLAGMASSNLTITVNYKVYNVTISQNYPFSVTVKMNMSYQIIDVFATIKKNITVITEVPIIGINDPLPAAEFGWVRPIEETRVKESGWNLRNLTRFVEREQYVHHPRAPSFLMRFTGDLSSSACCGIESVLSAEIYSDMLNPAYLPNTRNSSYVDHMFFYDLANGPRFGCGEDVYRLVDYPPPNKPIDRVQLDKISLGIFNISSSDWLSSGCGT